MQTLISSTQLRIASLHSRDVSITPQGSPRISHLALHTADGIRMIEIREIIRIESDSNYCVIYCADGHRHVASRTLRTVEALLPADQFARVHQSHLVRITQLKVVHKDEVVLVNGDRLPLSRSQRNVILNQLQAFSVKI